MNIEICEVEEIIEINRGVFILKLLAPRIASSSYPGQFCNIKVCHSSYPLLRRPFSVCDADGEYIYFMFNVHGEGTLTLANKKRGDTLDVLGPLGAGFEVEDDYETAVIVAGGMGAAPFPFLTRRLRKERKIISFIGGKTYNDAITYGIDNYHIATEDGTLGFKGNVIELLEDKKSYFGGLKTKFFGCGPNSMLKALTDFCSKNNFECKISTEAAMACGFGICQGCAIKSNDSDGYSLVCKDGPVFDSNKVRL